MSLAINAERPENIQALIDKWLEQEQNGVRFPVDFEIAWYIAGYSRKDSAKRKLSKMTEGTDFHRLVEVKQRHQRGAVEVEVFSLTCDALKHFCLLAETEEGRQIRNYFIECEKKWKLVEKHHPEIAQEIDIELRKMQAQAEILKLQNDNLRMTVELRHLDSTMITLHGPELVLALRGKSDQIVKVETVVTEVVNPKTERCDRIVSSDQLKQIVKQNTGQSIKSMKWFVDEVKRLNRNDLLVAVTRHQTGEYVSADGLSEAIALVFSNNRQMVIGE